MRSRNTIPLYLQIASLLIRDIQARRYEDGDRLPPERALAAELGTTVTTLRKSLAELEKKGFLDRVQGSGNFVRSQGTDDSIYSFFRIELVNGSGLPRAELINVGRYQLDPPMPQFTKSGYGFRFRRRRFLNDILVAFEEIWLDDRFADEIDSNQVLPSLYLYYRQKFGLWITHAEDQIGAAIYPEWVDGDAILAPNKPCIYIERKSWSQENQLVEFSKTWFANERARYVARLK